MQNLKYISEGRVFSYLPHSFFLPFEYIDVQGVAKMEVSCSGDDGELEKKKKVDMNIGNALILGHFYVVKLLYFRVFLLPKFKEEMAFL